MKKYTLFIIAITLLYTIPSQGQHLDSLRDHIWIIGTGCDTLPQFNTSDLVFTDTGLVVHAKCRLFFYTDTNTSICNDNGELCFYSSGYALGDTTNQIMANSYTSLVGLSFSEIQQQGITGQYTPQSLLSLPLPDHPEIDYVFGEHLNVSQATNAVYGDTFNYSVVDMSAHNGLGRMQVITQFIKADSFEWGQITACRHANGRDWWIIVPGLANNKYHTFLFDNTGIHDAGVQTVGPPFSSTIQTYGQAVFSPDGTKYLRFALNSRYISAPFRVYDFDRCSGALQLREAFQVPVVDTTTSAGVAVSPNSRFAYLTTDKRVYQYDLLASNIETSGHIVGVYDGYRNHSTAIVNHSVSFCEPQFGLAELAPDGKIYIATDGQSQYLHVIEQPNLPLEACDFRQRGIHLPTFNAFSIPNYPYFRLGALAGSGCDTILGVRNVVAVGKDNITIFPNPANNQITVKAQTGNISGRIELVDVLGNIVYSDALNNATEYAISTQHIADGTYYCRILGDGTPYTVKKIVVLH